MRVLHFAESMEYNVDGVVRYIYRLINYLNKRRITSLFVTGKLPTVEHRDAPMVRVPSFTLPIYKKYQYALPIKVKKIIQDFRPDVMHFHSPFSLAWAALAYGHRMGIPVVATYHTNFVSYMKYYNIGWLEKLGWQYTRAVYKSCDLVLVPSQYTKKELWAKGLHNVVFLPHGVDMKTFNPRFRNIHWHRRYGGGKKIILYVGRLIWEKNIKVLAEINSILRKRRHDFEFVIAGEGPKKKDMQRLMPEAIFIGHVAGRKLAECYASSDIFVFPSTTETFGFVTIEAMASGSVPVCSAVGGASSIISNGKTGFLVGKTDARLYAQRINTLLDNPSLLKSMRRNGIAFARQQRWDRIFNQLINHYKTVIRRNKSSRL
jgi:phosphatidylinositol alpha 1,6-mannosyltransferase